MPAFPSWAFTRWHHHNNRQQTSNCSLLLIYRPRKDERLSWPCWLTYSGWFTHISGHPSAAGRAQDSECTPAKDRRCTAGPRNQPDVRCSCNIKWQQQGDSTVYCVDSLLARCSDDIADHFDQCCFSGMARSVCWLYAPYHRKVQKKLSSGTGSPEWSRKKGRKMVVVVMVWTECLFNSVLCCIRSNSWTSGNISEMIQRMQWNANRMLCVVCHTASWPATWRDLDGHFVYFKCSSKPVYVWCCDLSSMVIATAGSITPVVCHKLQQRYQSVLKRLLKRLSLHFSAKHDQHQWARPNTALLACRGATSAVIQIFFISGLTTAL